MNAFSYNDIIKKLSKCASEELRIGIMYFPVPYKFCFGSNVWQEYICDNIPWEICQGNPTHYESPDRNLELDEALDEIFKTWNTTADATIKIPLKV